MVHGRRPVVGQIILDLKGCACRLIADGIVRIGRLDCVRSLDLMDVLRNYTRIQDWVKTAIREHSCEATEGIESAES